MSVIQPSFVVGVAEGLGIKPTDDAIKTLAPDVEYRLREIVQEAAKFARHSRRTYITPEDINNAFRLRNVEPVYGLSNASDPARFVRLAGYPDVYYQVDPILPLTEAIEAAMPPTPWEAGLKIHWMAVNGTQPAIPENVPLLPTAHRVKRQRREEAAPPPMPTAAAAAVVIAAEKAADKTTPEGINNINIINAAAGGGAGGTIVAGEEGALVRAPVRQFLSKELQAYNATVVRVLQESSIPSPQTPGITENTSSQAFIELRAVLSSLRMDAGLQPLAPIFANFFSQSIADQLEEGSSAPAVQQGVGGEQASGEEATAAAADGAAGGGSGAGQQAAAAVQAQGHAAEVPGGRLRLLLRAIACLALNPAIDLSRYLHQLAPAVLTCLLARQVGTASVPLAKDTNTNTNTNNANTNTNANGNPNIANKPNAKNANGGVTRDGEIEAASWEVRDQAAKTIAALCASYPETAAPRIQRQLVAALTSPSSSLQTLYGAVAGIAAQGPRVVKALLLPQIIPCIATLADDLAGKKGGIKMAAAMRVRGAILIAAGHCVYLSGVCDPWGGMARAGAGNNGGGSGGGGGGGSGGGGRRVNDTVLGSKGVKSLKVSKEASKMLKVSPGRAAEILRDMGGERPKSATTSGGGDGGKKGGTATTTASVAASASTGAANTHPLTVEDLFSKEEIEEEEINNAAAAEANQRAAAKWMQKVPRGAWRPASAAGDASTTTATARTSDGGGGNGGGGATAGLGDAPDVIMTTSLPDTNYLEEAWREDFPVMELWRGMEAVFGNDIGPYESAATGANTAAFV